MSDDTPPDGIENANGSSDTSNSDAQKSADQLAVEDADGEVAKAAERTKTLADVAGGGSNKGSYSGSNEDFDQAGGNRDS